jgi:uncharacterized protein (TIGR03067 family)
MRSIASLTLLVATAFGAATSPTFAEEPKDDLAKLQGSWTAKAGPNKDIPVTMIFKGSKFEVKLTRPDGEEATLKGELKVDEKADPKTFDFVNFKGPQGEEIADNLGIYKLDGDTWNTCSGGPGNERPTRFEAGKGGPPNLATWTRVKDAAEEKPIKGDLAKLQGTWTAPAGPNDDLAITMTVKFNAYTASWDRGDGTKLELRGELRVNEKATPHKTIDFFNTKRDDGEDARDSLGIYEFDGEKVKFCVGGAGEERPAEFKRGVDGAPHILIFTRKKD